MEPTHGNEPPAGRTGLSRFRARWVFAVFAAIAAFFLLTEHRAHLFGALPFLLLLACPLMHLFMHHGHGDRHQHRHGQDEGEPK